VNSARRVYTRSIRWTWRRLATRACPGLALLGALLLCSPALADPAAQARFHDELARGHYKAGRFEQALREFFLEQRISPNPRIAFNIALCFQDLKRNEEAFQYLSEYLASDDADPERRSYAEKAVEVLKRGLALVRIVSEPPGAAIYIDRRELGSYGTTPKVVALTPGEHQVWAELAGYSTAAGTVVAKTGEELPLSLAPERIVGRLVVSSPVAGQATVRGAGGDTVARGDTPLHAELPPGSYEVTVAAGGHLPWTGLARVEAAEDASVEAAPVAAPEPTGSITVTSNVQGALVELNGSPVGFSPTVLSSVGVGSQRLRLVSPGLVPWAGDVQVRADERSWLTVSLEEPRTVRTSPATWIAGSVSAAALLTSGVLAIFAAKTHSDFENSATGAERNALRERGITLNTAADVALVTGAAAAATAAVLYFTTREVRGRPSSASTTRDRR
jgi:outer membrane receptor for ferrienterochelin and colicins